MDAPAPSLSARPSPLPPPPLPSLQPSVVPVQLPALPVNCPPSGVVPPSDLGYQEIIEFHYPGDYL